MPNSRGIVITINIIGNLSRDAKVSGGGSDVNT
jgi:hypothetical protein